MGAGRWVCMVGEAMEQFTMQGMDHMEWDEGSDQFIKTSPQDPPLMKMQVKVLPQVQKTVRAWGCRRTYWQKRRWCGRE